MSKRRIPGEITYTIVSLLKGLAVTFTNLWRKKVTLQYPEERWELPDKYRGMPGLPVDPKTGKNKCIACGACARVCPEQIIKIQHEVGEDKKRKLITFDIDISRCMFCGLCSEACPTDAVQMSKTFELSSTTRDQMVMHMDDLEKAGGFWPVEPEPEPKAEETDAEEEKSESGGTAH